MIRGEIFIASLIIGLCVTALDSETSPLRRLLRSSRFVWTGLFLGWAVPTIPTLLIPTGLSRDAAVVIITVVTLEGFRLTGVRLVPVVEGGLSRLVGPSLVRLNEQGKPPTARNIVVNIWRYRR